MRQHNRKLIAIKHGFQFLGFAGKDMVFNAGKFLFAIEGDGSLKKLCIKQQKATFYRTFTQAHEGFEQVQEKIYWGNLLWERFQTD